MMNEEEEASTATYTLHRMYTPAQELTYNYKGRDEQESGVRSQESSPGRHHPRFPHRGDSPRGALSERVP